MCHLHHYCEDEERLLLCVKILLSAVLGIGGKAKFDRGALGTVSASSGVILIIVGVIFLSAGI